MGKKSKVQNPPPAAATVDESIVVQGAEIKDKGNKFFGEGDYVKALDTYDKGIKLLVDCGTELADLHSNKAACFLQMKRYKEAVRECSAALNASPGFSKALQRRSKAYEQQGLYKQALTDIQQVNRGESSGTETTREVEKRLKDILAGRRSGTVNGNPARPARKTALPPVLYITAKCTLDEETKLIHLSHTTSYAELLEVMKVKFPNSGPVVLKWLDKEGDLVTITERADLNNAMAEVLAAYDKQVTSGHGPRLPPQLPPVRIQLQRVEKDSQVPDPPLDEILERQRYIAAQKMQQLQQAGKKDEEKKVEVPASTEEGVYEIDDWLVDFANLFKENAGLEGSKLIDLHKIGVEKCQRALETAIHSDKALPIFDEAMEKFKEVTCVGLLNWGNAYLCAGHKLASDAATKGKSGKQAEKGILELFDKAEDRYNQAMEYKDDFYDGVLALAQLEFERAKVKIGLLIEPPSESGGEKQEAAMAMNEAMKKALSRIDKSKIKPVQSLVDKSWELYKKGVELGEGLDKQQEKDKAKRGGVAKSTEQSTEGGEEPGLRTHALVMWGNVMFEQSQILAVTGGDWKGMVDEAVGKFKDAGCNEKDITQALRTHIKASEMDLPAVEDEEKKQEEGGQEKPTKVVKGLPPL